MTTMTQPQKPAREAGLKRSEAQPILHPRGKEIQPFGALARQTLGLDEDVHQTSVQLLNPLLSDTMVLRDLYKKHHCPSPERLPPSASVSDRENARKFREDLHRRRAKACPSTGSGAAGAGPWPCGPFEPTTRADAGS